MNFLSPLAFWFALALPVVVAFYLLKRRRRSVLVSSTVFWHRFLAEAQANAPFQRLRRNWLLWLQLLLLALLVLALARPYYSGEADRSGLKVVIMDVSASMQTADVEPSRFEVARREAMEWLAAKGDSERVILLTAAARPEVVQSETADRAVLGRAMQSIQVTDSPTHMEEALRLADSLIGGRAEASIHLFSDGAFPPLTEFENRVLPLQYHPVGNGGRNAGIEAIDLRSNPEEPSRRSLFLRLRNFTGASVAGEVELRFDRQLVEVRPARIEATNSLGMVFHLRQPRDGVVTARFRVEDDYAPDNEASLVSLLPRDLRVVLVSPGNAFLERAISAVERVRLTVVDDLASVADAYDLAVLDNVNPAVWPEGNVLAMRVSEPDWFPVLGTLEAPPIAQWQSDHPLLRYVSLDGVLVAEAMKIETPPWASPVVESTRNPLIVAGERGNRRVVWVGFDVLDSNWPKQISFPIFMANAMDWLNPQAFRARRQTLQAGQTIRYFPSAEESEKEADWEMVRPDGSREVISPAGPSSPLVFSHTSQHGVYQLVNGDTKVPFAVHAVDPEESRIAARPELQLGEYQRAGRAELVPTQREYWRWFGLAALGFLLFEWWFYHRRTA